MASGDTLVVLTALNNSPPATRYATFDTFSDGSTPALTHPVLDFDPGATTEFADFICVMPRHYGGGGLTITVGWSSDATTGNVKWDIFLKSVTDDADDLDTKAFAAANSVTATTATAAGEVDYAAITFTDGADMDSIAAGEMFILRLERDSADAADTMDSNDAELHFIEIKET